jgi:signal transduction histidine kinase
MGHQVLGVIRCAVAKEEPHYFSDQELSLLVIIAARIGQYWNNWLRRREVLQENKSWRALIESIGQLNSFVHTELTKQEPDEHRIFAEALRVTSAVIQGAEIMDIRLLDLENRELYFAETRGNIWNEGTEQEIVERRSRRFPITDGPPNSAGAQVFKTGRVYLIPDTLRDPYYSETFSSGRMIIAPIKVKSEVFGVLDIRTIGKADFPRHADVVAELLGQQLGLYRYLAATIRNLRKVQADLGENITALETFQTDQTQTFEDLKHQLYGPITQAHARIQAFLRNDFPNIELALKDNAIAESLAVRLLAIRGLCAKAKRVVSSVGLFSQLSLGNVVSTNPKPLQPEALVKMIIEDSRDINLMTDPDRHIRFHVDRQSFDVMRSSKFEVDHELIEQAIMNLLDNAAKYSFRNTTVYIHAGITRIGRFRITVSNRGLPISSRDMPRCVERGWRSKEAKLAIGEGSGIGLWIVDKIMKAHAGELVITPTSTRGLTEISLIFAGAKEVGVPS